MDKLIIILILIIAFLLFDIKNNFTENVSDILTYTETSSDLEFIKNIKLISDPNKDVKLKPLGCFSNLSEYFFYKKINPFSKIKEFNSLFVIKDSSSFQDLLNEVNNNGFGDYVKKLDKNFNNIKLQELAVLGLFAGYKYISLYKKNEKEYGKIFLSYSPPMNKHNIYGQFTKKEYSNSLLEPDLPLESCGFKCNDGYMCGSENYPNIKNTQHFAVYEITESV